MLSGLLFAPVFFVVGAAIYRVYYASFERTGQEALSGLAFFFGLMFIIEVSLIMIYGVDYRLVGAPYIGATWQLGPVDVPLRMLVPFAVALAMTAGVYLYLSRTFAGRAILAVAQDRLALRLMGADPVRIKQHGLRPLDRDRSARRRAADRDRPGRALDRTGSTSAGCSRSSCWAAWARSAARWSPA